jgi:hypothetical protein
VTSPKPVCRSAIRLFGCWFGYEAVADAADSEQVGRFGWVRLEIAAQADDEVVDRSRVGIFVDAPDVFEDLFARDDFAGVLDQIAEQVSLHQRQVDELVGRVDF